MRSRKGLFIFLVVIFLMSFFATGCINNVADDGSIHGKLYVYEGNQPALNPVKVRVEAIPAYGNDATKRLNFRYVIIEPSGHGEYRIDNVPPGKYKIQFDIQNKEAAYAYLVKLGNHPSEGENHYSDDEVPYAYVESGRDYEMPDYYIKKIEQTGKGAFKGKIVYSPLQIPMEGVTIILNHGGDIYSGITNDEGVVVISDLPANVTYDIQLPANYELYNTGEGGSSPGKIYITPNQTVEKTYILKYNGTNKPVVRGIINIPTRFDGWITKDDVLVHLNLAGSATETHLVSVEDGFFFQTQIEPWISKYQFQVSLKEPFASNTVIYPIPSQNPGDIHELPDGAINLEVAHKNVLVKIYPPTGYAADGEIIFSVKYGETEKSFIAREAGNYWQATVDLPYGTPEFNGVTKLQVVVDGNKQELELIPLVISISENSGDVVTLHYPVPTSGG